MAVNRFDTPAQAQFVNTHVPIPFQELQMAAQARQAKLDENLARLDAAQIAMDQLNYIPNSPDQLKVEEWQRNLSDLATQYIDKDLSDPEIYRELRSGIRQAVNPNEVKAVQQSYAGYQNYMKSQAQMQAKGDRTYNPYDFSQHDTLQGSGVFNQLPMMDLGEQADIAIKKFLTTPEENWRRVKDEYGAIGTERYRDINEIYNLIDNNSGQLMDNPAIQQFMERNNLDQEGFKQYLRQQASSYEIISAGSFQFPPGYGRESTGGEGKVDFYNAPALVDTGMGGPKGKRRIIKQNILKSEDIFNGLKVGKGDISFDDRLEGFFGGDPVDKKRTLEFGSKDDKALFNTYLDAAEKYYGGSGYQNLSPKEKIEKVDNYLEYRQTRERYPEVLTYLDEKALKSQQEITAEFGGRDNAPVYDLSRGTEQHLRSVRELKNEYPVVDDGGGYTWHVIGETGDVPRQELSNSKQVEIRDAEGQHVGTYFIGGGQFENLSSNFRNSLVRNILYNAPLEGSTEKNYLPGGEFNFPIGGINWTISWSVEEREGQLPEYSVRILYPEEAWTNPGVPMGSGFITGNNISQLEQGILSWAANEAQ